MDILYYCEVEYEERTSSLSGCRGEETDIGVHNVNPVFSSVAEPDHLRLGPTFTNICNRIFKSSGSDFSKHM